MMDKWCRGFCQGLYRLGSMDNRGTLYTPAMAGSGQFGICSKCLKGPTKDGHDGCLGTLPSNIMNACCGHGLDRQAYIQYWGGYRISGTTAIEEQQRLLRTINKIDRT